MESQEITLCESQEELALGDLISFLALSKYIRPVIYARSNPNRSFTQAVGLVYSL